MTPLESFKDKIKKGEVVVGSFMKVGDPAFVEIAGYAGYDFVILDLEHGPSSIESAQNLVRAAQVAGTVPIIRTPDNSEIAIQKAMDIGASGIQPPQINSAEEAKRAVLAAKYAPDGVRGVCRFVRSSKYSSMDRFEYFKSANENLVVLQLEGKSAIDNLDEILDVKGVDIVFIGPYDLSSSLGIIGQVDHPMLIETMKEVIKKAKAKGIAVGIFADKPEAARMWRDAGVQYMAYSNDTGIFLEACAAIVKAVKE